jgi:hypothetical protein
VRKREEAAVVCTDEGTHELDLHGNFGPWEAYLHTAFYLQNGNAMLRQDAETGIRSIQRADLDDFSTTAFRAETAPIRRIPVHFTF